MNELTAAFARLAPWVFKFRIRDQDYGGAISALGDERLERFFCFAPDAARVLELGSLEGAHTVQIAARPGMTEVVAIEGRAANIAKASLVQRASGIANAEFVQANLEETDLASFGRFDAIFCSGLLYHLPEPWKLVEALPAVAPKLFIWTHYARDAEAEVISHGLRGKIFVESGLEEPLSGMSPTSMWLTLGSLITALTRSGYGSIHVLHNDLTHPNGPAVTIGATTSALPPSISGGEG